MFIRFSLIILLLSLSHYQIAKAAIVCSEIFEVPKEVRIREAITERKVKQNQLFKPLIEAWSQVLKNKLDANPEIIEKMYLEEVANLRISTYADFFKYFDSPKLGEKREDNKTQFVENLPHDLYWFMRDSALANTLPGEVTGNFIGRHYFYWRGGFQEHPAFMYQPVPIIAIGKGDPLFYRDLILTTTVAMRLIYESRGELATILEKIDSSSVPFARRNDKTELSHALTALLEAQTSASQLISILAYHEVPGISRLELTKKLLSRNNSIGASPLSSFTRLLPIGITGPFHSRGHFFSTEPLKVNKKGDILPSDDFVAILRIIQKDREKYLEIDRNGEPSFVGSCQGCPLTIRNGSSGLSGVDSLADSFLKIYQAIVKQ